MNDIKSFIGDLSIDAFEANIKIAGIAVVSDSGKLIYQTENFDISNQTKAILNLFEGERSIILNGHTFLVVGINKTGIIATSESGMGHIIIVPFQGGVLLSYAMPKADPAQALNFLKNYAMRLNGVL
jgi:hypothetical protein